MKGITILPGLILDEEAYGLARKALERQAPQRVPGFTYEWFMSPPNWFLIPDPQHPEWPFFKAELQIPAAAGEPRYQQTIKLNYWLHPDLRATGQPMPHSHPWNQFQGHVLRGGYEEDRYEVSRKHLLVQDPHSKHDLGTVSLQRGVQHVAGEANLLEVSTFHEVTKILQPGTLSLMDCGPGKKEGWGYVDPDTGLYVPNKMMRSIDENFKDMLRKRNQHRRR